MVEVYKKGILNVGIELHIVAKTQKGSMHLSGGEKRPGILKVDSIDMNNQQFSIDGQWFDMNDFAFEKPVLVEVIS